MTIQTKILLFSASIIAGLMVGGMNRVSADSGCVTQYGGSQYGTPCAPTDLVINKEVQKPGVKDAQGNPVYVENLSVTDASASAGTFLTFRLTIKNNSNQTFDPVTVKDIFPPFMNYVSGGPSGTTYDFSTKTMTTKIKLQAGQSQQLVLVAKIDDSGFPVGKTTLCVVNTANVKASDRFDEDTAQVCIATPSGKGGTLPKAGFNDIFVLLPFALLCFAGVNLLTKKA